MTKNPEYPPYVPYDTSLKDLARKNRKDATEAEKKIWNEILKNDQLKGLRFNRQKPIDKYIVDFYCPKLMLAIEIDGNSHVGKDAEEYDENRTIDLKQYGVKVIRYTNSQVLNDIEFVKKDLLKKIKNKTSPLDKGGGPPRRTGGFKTNKKRKSLPLLNHQDVITSAPIIQLIT